MNSLHKNYENHIILKKQDNLKRDNNKEDKSFLFTWSVGHSTIVWKPILHIRRILIRLIRKNQTLNIICRVQPMFFEGNFYTLYPIISLLVIQYKFRTSLLCQKEDIAVFRYPPLVLPIKKDQKFEGTSM